MRLGREVVAKPRRGTRADIRHALAHGGERAQADGDLDPAGKEERRGQKQRIGHEIAGEVLLRLREVGAGDRHRRPHRHPAEAGRQRHAPFDGEQRPAVGAGKVVHMLGAVGQRVGGQRQRVVPERARPQQAALGLDLPVKPAERPFEPGIGRGGGEGQRAIRVTRHPGQDLVELHRQFRQRAAFDMGGKQRRKPEGHRRDGDEDRRGSGHKKPQAQRRAVHAAPPSVPAGAPASRK